MKKRLTGVEAARGVAALLVVFYHTALHVEGDVGGVVLWHLPHFGHAGVDFFFVLSGFIITFVHRRDMGSPDRLGHYVQRRFTRVFPFYWAVLAFYVLDAALLHPAADHGVRALIDETFLLPWHAPLIVGGAWTLVFEITFYSAFAALVVSKHIGGALFGTWLCALLAATVDRSWVPPSAFAHLATSPYCLEFFLGMACAYALGRYNVKRPSIMFWGGVTLFLVAGIGEVLGVFSGFGAAARFIYGPCSALIIAGIVTLETQGKLTVPRPLAILGRASYAVYLVHLVALGIAFHILSRLIHLTPSDALLLWGVLCATGVTTGILASVWIEQPLIRMSRRVLSHGTKSHLTTAS